MCVCVCVWIILYDEFDHLWLKHFFSFLFQKKGKKVLHINYPSDTHYTHNIFPSLKYVSVSILPRFMTGSILSCLMTLILFLHPLWHVFHVSPLWQRFSFISLWHSFSIIIIIIIIVFVLFSLSFPSSSASLRHYCYIFPYYQQHNNHRFFHYYQQHNLPSLVTLKLLQ